MFTNKQSLKTKLTYGTILGAIAGLSSPGFAQEIASEQISEESDVIVVTGRLRGASESVQDVPLAVTVVSPEQLGAQGALSIEDLETLSPSLVIDGTSSGPGAAAISIRGVSFEDVEKSFEPTVGVVIDGVFSGTNTAQLTNAFDFQQVEVLRGPQGTLFGRNTIGGVINVQRSRPTKEFGVRGEISIGNYGREDYNAVLNFGDGDVFGAKLFASDRTFDGFYDNVTLGQRTGANNVRNAGGTILLEPTVDLEILLTAEITKIDGDPASSSLSQTGEAICAIPGLAAQCNRDMRNDLYTVFSDTLGTVEYKENAYSAQINYDIGDLTITSITALKDSDELVIQDFDSTSIPFFTTERAQQYRQFSQEFRLAGDFTDTISGVIGLFYFNNEYQLQQVTTVSGTALPAETDHETKSYAIFADFDWQLTDQLRLSLGGRYSKDKKSYTRSIFAGPGPLLDLSNKDSWGQFTPRVSMDYRFTDDILAYASYARGYRSGGFNGRANSPTSVAVSFDPETVDSFEIGTKTQFMDGRITLNAAGFYTKYNNKQENVVQATPPGSPNPQETVTLNVASASILGAEVDLRAELFEGFTVSSSLGLLDAKYDEFFIDLNLDGVQDPGEDASSRDLRRAPKVSFSIAGNYEVLVGNQGTLNFNAKYSTTSSYQTTITADPNNFGQNDPRGLHQSQDDISASITYKHTFDDNSNMYVRVFGRNLADNRGLGSALPVAGLFTFGSAIAPRQYGVTVGFDF